MTTEAVAVLPTSEDRIRAALWFAEHGFGVFSCWSAREDGTCRCPAGAACDSPGKHPITGNGFKDATRDAARIRTLLSAASDPNYGVVPPPGSFAWDIDGDDLLRLAELEERLGSLPATLETLTAHGKHAFYRWPDAFPRPIHRMFGFVTRWGSGELAGYVIGPRSVHPSGAVYTPAGIAEIATLPDAWAQAVLDGQARPRITVIGRLSPGEVRVGGRHDWLRDTARHYAGVVRDPDALFAAVWTENQKLAEPKTEEAVRRAIGDVLERFGPDPVEEDPDTGDVRRVSDDEVGLLGPAASGDFPPGPDPVAFSGLLGECVLALGEGTDASLVGILGSLVAFAGALIPGQAYQHRMQTTSPFIALVGESSIGRKGTAMWRAHDAMADALDPVFVNRVLLDGLNSGEGLISALAFKQETFKYEPTVGLVFEEEYASLLAARGRDGSTLDPRMRAAFDGGPLSNRRSNETRTVSPPYWLPALIGITPVELRRRLEPDALQSGSANRWLYLPVRRREVVPTSDEPRVPEPLRAALRTARRVALERERVLEVAPVVTRHLSGYADFLARASFGTAADLTRRLPVIAFRIALVHAMADRAEVVGADHVGRAVALTEYARAGLDWVFGGTVANPHADLLLRSLRKTGALRKHTITREIIRDPVRRQEAIDELVRLGYAAVVTVHTTGGRPREELRLDPRLADSVRSVHPYAPLPDMEGDERGRNGRNNVEAWTEPGRRPDGTWTEPGRNDPDPPPAPDSATATWASPCRDYRAHQDQHRNTPEGWVCLACQQGGAS